MTDTNALADQIEALAAKATPSPLSDGGYYFSETCSDLTKCSHDETGYYLNDADGDLIAALWNNRETLIAAQRAAERAEAAGHGTDRPRSEILGEDDNLYQIRHGLPRCGQQ